MLKLRMIGHGRKSHEPNIALANAGMSVLMATQWIFAIVNMNSMQLISTNKLVKLLQYTFQIVDDIITAIKNMASI